MLFLYIHILYSHILLQVNYKILLFTMNRIPCMCLLLAEHHHISSVQSSHYNHGCVTSRLLSLKEYYIYKSLYLVMKQGSFLLMLCLFSSAMLMSTPLTNICFSPGCRAERADPFPPTDCKTQTELLQYQRTGTNLLGVGPRACSILL